MVDYGRKACAPFLSSTLTLDQKLGLTYYDAERVYYQVAAYTGDGSWKDCATKAEAVYKDYVLRNNGGVPGYWNFTTGFQMDWQLTTDSTSKQAAVLLSKNGAYCTDVTPLEWTANASKSREVAYCLMSYLNAEALGEPRRARMTQHADQALGHIDQWFISKTARAPSDIDVAGAAGQYYIQPFMVGLTAQALIRYWEVTKDPRVQPAIKIAMDALWNRAWVAADQAFWYQNWVTDPAQVFPAKPGAPDLNLLIAPAYAWLYSRTGDTTYRDRGDQIFAGGVKRAWLDGSKQFNQNYMWSFDYVKWRSE
jgi:hypothetical protein